MPSPACRGRGTIRYDGIELKTPQLPRPPSTGGFILQENHLFNDTIARNIAFGETEPDMDSVIWASRVASNAVRVRRAAAVGLRNQSRRVRLAISGGQRQRVTCAPSIIDRPFWFSTSDERARLERTRGEGQPRPACPTAASFVIAHRLSTALRRRHDRRSREGAAGRAGHARELMKHQGLYYYLVSRTGDVMR
jgi:ATP-binding cassette subfamily B protein